MPFFFSIEVGRAGRRVIWTQALTHTSIALPGHIARGKMKQGRVIRPADEFDKGICRTLNHLFEGLWGGTRLLPTNQEIKFSYLGEIHERVGEPHFADEAGNTDHHDAFSA